MSYRKTNKLLNNLFVRSITDILVAFLGLGAALINSSCLFIKACASIESEME